MLHKNYREIEDAIKEGNWKEMVELCEKHNFSETTCDELVLMALYEKHHKIIIQD